jgi:hypothetical protein
VRDHTWEIFQILPKNEEKHTQVRDKEQLIAHVSFLYANGGVLCSGEERGGFMQSRA